MPDTPTPPTARTPELDSILALEVPIIVRLGDRRMHVAEVMDLLPGRIIELEKSAEEELEIYVNNRRIGRGTALKVGENFGVKVTSVEALHERIEAMRDRAETAAVGPADAA